MINLVCRKCGWRAPLLKNTSGNLVNLNVTSGLDFICPECNHKMTRVKPRPEKIVKKRRNKYV